ncbi:amidohydrolase 3 [Trichoderma longibrachiatum]|uniref:Amidohydrolase 3 n=1 Tax=Trichoderma longibrachiatum ATCC 18648 TaxID=983965 RepID=A0A2T4CJC0_TRILO|nr:amidohydrolase 3 [Trichoderma longibrachiatum ATCC 18648]
MAATLFTNGKFFTTQEGNGNEHDAKFHECMLVENGMIEYVGGDNTDIRAVAASKDAAIRDLDGNHVLPGFIDGHVHALLLGQSLQRLNLEGCQSLPEIRETITAYASARPNAPRILCGGWMEFMTDGKADVSMLDDLDPRPIYIISRDLHSCWCNTAAIKEMGLETTPDPVGGTIHRDAQGRALGLLSEAACTLLVWPHLAQIASPEERVGAMRDAIQALHAVGCTGCVEMAMDDIAWDALQTLRAEMGGQLSLHIAAHWLIRPAESTDGDSEELTRAIALSHQFNASTSPDFRIVGIKIMCDGVVDSCTAALIEPYCTTGVSTDPIWTPEALGAVVRRADRAGLQCALHAIGDAAARLAIDALSEHGTPGRRHRIEHLELTSPGDGARLAAAGITASIQPAHADPVLLKAWPELLGTARCGRAFAYGDFAASGANISIGSDSPTAPWDVLRNLYTAMTRRSVRDQDYQQVMNPEFALSLCQAMQGATRGSAYSCFAEGWTGSLAKGLQANFAVAKMEWTPESLLKARVQETWYKGKKVYDAAKSG